MRKRYSSLALREPDLLFGRAQLPLKRNGLVLGGGTVIPEIKFTLPPIEVEEGTFKEITGLYDEMIRGICERARDLHQNELIVEFELLPPMTMEPSWGEAITALLRKTLDEFRTKEGLKSCLRVTPVDIRESTKPPKRREGRDLDLVLESFRRCAAAGGDLLSIESTGGKEVTDQAVMAADLRGTIFGTGILGSADMEFLWSRIVGIARDTGTVPAGDTACGIGNTAMILADQGYIPKVYAAVVRAITAVRSIVAYEVGAVGPGKDCGYENAYLKAITGLPMSMEGKSAACAHFSSLGNIAGAYADLWSNESVQHIKLLSGMAPVVSLEQLTYDCRLFNVSASHGKGLELRDWLIESDASLDPQAFILKPESVFGIAEALVGAESDYERSVKVAAAAIRILRQGMSAGSVLIGDREKPWLDRMEETMSGLPKDAGTFIEEEFSRWGEVADRSQYKLHEQGK